MIVTYKMSLKENETMKMKIQHMLRGNCIAQMLISEKGKV